MILYFANRKMEILGSAATNLPNGIKILEDVKTEETETGVATFSCKIPFTKKTRKKAEEYTEVGNYLLRSNGDENEFYTIIDAEIDTETRDIYVYAEDAGLELLNDIVLKVSYDSTHNQTWYVSETIKDTGFEIGIDESDDTEKQLSFDEETITKRLNSITEDFGYELSFSFSVENLSITHKYVNIYKKRGKDTGIQLRLNRDINKIITKKSVADLATALLVTGATPDGTDIPVTLDGYQYDDGDFYVDGHYLKSRNALDRWGRVVWKNDSGKMSESERHIVKTFTYDTVSQEELCKQSIAELKKVCDISANYEVDIAKLPDDVKIGDTVNIIDDEGELYLSARVLKLEKSVADKTNAATLGDYLIKESGISQKVEELAAQFSEIAKNRTLYTWIAYADDKYGSGITLDPDNKPYIGITTNKLKKEVDISDPSIFAWSKIEGGQGEPGRSQEKVEDQYYLSTSNTEAIGGEWSFKMPEWESGKYIWKRYAVTWSDGAVTYTNPVLDSAINHANEASDYAIQQAGVAKDSADNAKNAAISAENNAKTASDASIKAQNTANEANAIASTAQSVANAAQKAADEANADVAVISKEVSNIREDVAIVRDDLQGKVTTVKETMEAFYAKKTDVSDTEATIRAEISKSAAEIQTTMEFDYAKKTELTEVQSNLQTQVTQNATNITSAASAVEEVRIDASNAQNKAAEATVTAGNAQSAANEAIQKANDAQASATQSVQAAQAAQEKANDAQLSADTAQKAAENANVIAQAAQKDLDTAKENLETVKNRVGVTEEDIAEAQAAVDTAQKAADSAKADATNASSAAAAAQKVADKAKSDAATAQSAADIAQKNAQNAKTAADNAQKSADEANAAIGNLANTVTTMSTKVDQNAEAITLAATKKEVENKLSGYLTTSEMNSAINQSASSVLMTVEGKYTTKTDFNNLKIGGRNLLMHTAYGTIDGVNNRGNYHTVSVDTVNKHFGRNSLKIVCSTVSVSGSQDVWQKLWSSLTVGDNLILSFWIKGSVASKMWCRIGGGGADNNIANVNAGTAIGITTEWKKVTFNFGKCTLAGEAGAVEVIYGFGNSGTFWINSMKLEIGTKATDWTPAPEDTEEQIKSVKASLELKVNKDTLISEINASADVITLTGNRFIVDSDNFKLTEDGTVTANNVNLTGTFTANSGLIDDLTGETVEFNTNVGSRGIVLERKSDKSKYTSIDNSSIIIDGGNVDDPSMTTVLFSPRIQLKYTLGGTAYSTNIRYNSISLSTNGNDNIFAQSNGTIGAIRYIFSNDASTLNYITCQSYNDTYNNYYDAEGYHAFYCNGVGIAYINSEGITMGDYDIKFNLGNGIKYGSSEWILRPYTSGDYNVTALGNGNRRTVLYGSQVRLSSATGTTVSSDKRLKKDFADFDERYDKFYMNLKPQMYRMAYTKNSEEYKITNGFIAQDVENALKDAGINSTELDLISCETADKDFLDEMFGGNPPDVKKQYSLNYSGFIALNTYMIQKTRKEMLYQAGKIDLHETIIQDLQNRIYQLEKQIKELRQAVA